MISTVLHSEYRIIIREIIKLLLCYNIEGALHIINLKNVHNYFWSFLSIPASYPTFQEYLKTLHQSEQSSGNRITTLESNTNAAVS